MTDRELLDTIRKLATEWATQPFDYDEDTEQQIADGRVLLGLLGDATEPDPPLGYVAGYPDILGGQLLVQADAERAFDTRESARQCVDQLNGLGDCVDEWLLLELRREVRP